MIIGIPVYNDVDMLDVAGPYEMFRWANLDVELVAERPGLLRFRKGFCFEVTKGFADAAKYDVLWVPGGDPDALVNLMGDPQRTFLDFLIDKSEGAKYVASVCEGAMLLAAAGLLDGYVATTHWAFVACLIQRFPKVIPAPGFPRYYLDRNRLTGGGSTSRSSSSSFCLGPTLRKASSNRPSIIRSRRSPARSRSAGSVRYGP